MNVAAKTVEIRDSKHTVLPGALQQAEDFVKAFALGFDVEDAVAIIRLDEIFVQSFEVPGSGYTNGPGSSLANTLPPQIKDVRTLEGDHLARAIGRICGKDGELPHKAGESDSCHIGTRF